MCHKIETSSSRARGFTIVELLIVIIVIAILAAIVIVAYNNVTTQAQNSKRMDDLAAVQKGLEMYFATYGRYPTTTGIGAPGTCLSSPGWNCWNASDTNRVLPQQFLSTVPQDPAFIDSAGCGRPNTHQSRMYGYQTTTAGDGYMIGAYLPGLSSSDPHYFDGSQDIGCLNYINYIIRYNM